MSAIITSLFAQKYRLAGLEAEGLEEIKSEQKIVFDRMMDLAQIVYSYLVMYLDDPDQIEEIVMNSDLMKYIMDSRKDSDNA